MKKTLLAGIVSLLFVLAINAQDSTSTKPVTQDTSNPAQTQTNPVQTQPMTQDQKSNSTQTQSMAQEQKKYGNPTVDSILSKYNLVAMPSQITTEQIFPVIGQYQSSTDASQKLTITLDDQNKGFAWVDGLPQGNHVKAVLKKSPATYKIPMQTTADGKEVPEGTLIYDKDAKTITVLLGRPFNDQDPASVFANPTSTDQSMATNDQTTTANDQSNMNVTKAKTTKSGNTKTKSVKKEEPAPAPWVFTGTKVEQVTSMNQ